MIKSLQQNVFVMCNPRTLSCKPKLLLGYWVHWLIGLSVGISHWCYPRPHR